MKYISYSLMLVGYYVTITLQHDAFRMDERDGVYKELFYPKEDYTNPTKGYSINHLPLFAEQNFTFPYEYVARFRAYYILKKSPHQLYMTCSGLCRISFSLQCMDPDNTAFTVVNEEYHSESKNITINSALRKRYCITVYHQAMTDQSNWLFVGEKKNNTLSPITTYVAPHFFRRKKSIARFFRNVGSLEQLRSSPNFPNSPDIITAPEFFQINALPVRFSDNPDETVGIYLVMYGRIVEREAVFEVKTSVGSSSLKLEVDGKDISISGQKMTTKLLFGRSEYIHVYLTAVGRVADIVPLSLFETINGILIGENFITSGISSERLLAIRNTVATADTITVEIQRPSALGFNSTFYVSYKEVEASEFTSKLVSTSSTITVTGLKVLTDYHVQLTATNYLRDYDVFTPVVSVTTLEGVPSKGPENVVAHTINCHHVRITWDPINATLTNGILVNYFVQYWMDGSAEPSLHSVGPDDTQANINQLEPWKSYFFKVAGSTSAGLGVFSSIVNVQQVYADPKLPPFNISIVTRNPYAVDISWQPIPIEQRKCFGLYYIRYKPLNDADWTEVITYQTSTTIDQLLPEVFYEYEVAGGSDIFGAANFSNSTIFATEPDVPSKSPGNFSVNAINYHHVRATWDQIDIPYRNGILTNYYVLYWEEASIVTSVYQAGPNETIADIDNLEPWKTYYFKIAGETSVGLGVFTNVLTVQQIFSAPTAPPSDITITSINLTSAVVNWMTIPANESQGAEIYHVRYKQLVDADWREVTTDQMSMIINRLDAEIPYEYQVAGKNALGVGAFSKSIIFATEPKASWPTKPPTLVHACFTSGSQLSIKIGEIPQNDRNGIILSYQVNISRPNGGGETVFNISAASRATLQYHRSSDPVVTTYNVTMAGFTEDGIGVIGNYTFQNILCRKASRRYISNAYFNNKRLMNHVIRVEYGAFDAVQCMLTFCEDDARCESVNYNKETKVCELNDMIYTNHAKNFVDADGWKFYQLMAS
ncbi:protein sidekick-2-like [Hydractinia symbiolongicarpus]|uniref:protein sidekick-2-like n=1 Tax=Hydractinia symbiolongicarpus TaxID=13093 RepID=UPI00254B065A|nr:protein sidekick-2-like [Hydractinia symbiolongicarpus]